MGSKRARASRVFRNYVVDVSDCANSFPSDEIHRRKYGCSASLCVPHRHSQHDPIAVEGSGTRRYCAKSPDKHILSTRLGFWLRCRLHLYNAKDNLNSLLWAFL